MKQFQKERNGFSNNVYSKAIKAIKNEDLLREPTFSLFVESIDSEYTRDSYIRGLKRFMAYRKVSNCEALLRGNTKEIESNIIMYLTEPHNKRLKKQSKKCYLAAVSHFYTMNDIVLNRKKIGKFIPKDNDIQEDRGYRKDEIQALLANADHRLRVVILLMASSGVRIGAVPLLRMSHLLHIQEPDIYRITVYQGTDEKHYTFCTPECKKAIDAYITYRKTMGEQFDQNSPLIREPIRRDDQFKAKHPKIVTERSLQQAIYQTAITAGLRKPTMLTESIIKGTIRHEVKITHGLKKFFVTQLTNARIDPARREYLASHKHGRNTMDTTQMMLIYDRPEQTDLLKEYVSAIAFLTIDESEKIATQNESLKQQLQTATVTRKEFDDLRRDLFEMIEESGTIPINQHGLDYLEYRRAKMTPAQRDAQDLLESNTSPEELANL